MAVLHSESLPLRYSWQWPRQSFSERPQVALQPATGSPPIFGCILQAASAVRRHNEPQGF